MQIRREEGFLIPEIQQMLWLAHSWQWRGQSENPSQEDDTFCQEEMHMSEISQWKGFKTPTKQGVNFQMDRRRQMHFEMMESSFYACNRLTII